jgi:hypothetical protein
MRDIIIDATTDPKIIPKSSSLDDNIIGMKITEKQMINNN